jgi:rSAM/selenodomain-associated transferase 2
MGAQRGRAVVVVVPWMAVDPAQGCTDTPALTLVIPVLDEAGQIQNTLAVLQPWRAWAQIIVVDGGSTDATVALALPLCDKVCRAAPGRAGQMNAGAVPAKGEYLFFLHADTAVGIDIKSLLLQLQAQPQWGFFRVRLSGRSGALRVIECFMNLRSRLTRVATGDQLLFVRRERFEAMGGFADIPLMEDVEICKRLRRQCAPLVIDTAVTTSSRRWESRGIVATVLTMWRLRLAYWLGADVTKLARSYRA